jgi:hypothetical protein
MCPIGRAQPRDRSSQTASIDFRPLAHATPRGPGRLPLSPAPPHPAPHSARPGAGRFPGLGLGGPTTYCFFVGSRRWLWRSLRVSQPQTPPRPPRRCCCLVPTSQQVSVPAWRCGIPVATPGDIVSKPVPAQMLASCAPAKSGADLRQAQRRGVQSGRRYVRGEPSSGVDVASGGQSRGVQM